MSYPNLGNGWTSTLSGAINSSDTTVDVAATAGMPSRPFQAVILAEGANSDEIVTVTNLSSSTITITRHTEANAAGSSSGSSHASGATISHVLTAGALRAAANATPKFVQGKDLQATNTQNPSLTLDATPTQGNVIVVATDLVGRGATSISQTNVTYTKVHDGASPGNAAYFEIWVGIVGGSPGTTITVNTGSSNWANIMAVELEETLTPTAGSYAKGQASLASGGGLANPLSGLTPGTFYAVLVAAENTTSPLTPAPHVPMTCYTNVGAGHGLFVCFGYAPQGTIGVSFITTEANGSVIYSIIGAIT